MSHAPTHPKDPIFWCGAMAAGFWLLALYNLGTPTEPYFDEVHYLPAAREFLVLGEYLNREHPPLGKELIALGIAMLGDNPWGWRIMSSLAGALALFGGMRALWFASASRYAAISFGILLMTGFHLFVHARIAMLDVFMAAFLAVALWQCAAAMREPETGRRRLVIAGVALGLAMAAKWNAVPLAMVPGLGFLVLRFMAGRRRLLVSRRGAPVPGISLLEAALWLGALPLAVYVAAYAPAWLMENGLDGTGPIAMTQQMATMQASVVQSHPYQSAWPDWVINRRAIWYLYEHVDGAQRGVLLVGNPLTMLLGLPALGWCLWRWLAKSAAAHGAAVVLYAVSLGFWMLADKPVQFYYHYFLPSCFLLAALALALDDLRCAGWRKASLAVLAASVAFFAFFYPILSAAPLERANSFAVWTWLDSWR